MHGSIDRYFRRHGIRTSATVNVVSQADVAANGDRVVTSASFNSVKAAINGNCVAASATNQRVVARSTGQSMVLRQSALELQQRLPSM